VSRQDWKDGVVLDLAWPEERFRAAIPDAVKAACMPGRKFPDAAPLQPLQSTNDLHCELEETSLQWALDTIERIRNKRIDARTMELLAQAKGAEQ
jgi:rhodanese-related sulfurtransferase